MRNFKNIIAYQLSDKFVLEIYKITKFFPKEEIYGVTSQIRRAAVSIPSNIAEGASRNHKKDYLKFLYISRGSIAETEYLLNLVKELEYLDKIKYKEIENMRQEISKTLFGLIKSVESEIN